MTSGDAAIVFGVAALGVVAYAYFKHTPNTVADTSQTAGYTPPQIANIDVPPVKSWTDILATLQKSTTPVEQGAAQNSTSPDNTQSSVPAVTKSTRQNKSSSAGEISIYGTGSLAEAQKTGAYKITQ